MLEPSSILLVGGNLVHTHIHSHEAELRWIYIRYMSHFWHTSQAGRESGVAWVEHVLQAEELF